MRSYLVPLPFAFSFQFPAVESCPLPFLFPLFPLSLALPSAPHPLHPSLPQCYREVSGKEALDLKHLSDIIIDCDFFCMIYMWIR